MYESTTSEYIAPQQLNKIQTTEQILASLKNSWFSEMP